MRVGFSFTSLEDWTNELTDEMKRYVFNGDNVFVLSVVGRGDQGTTAYKVWALTPYCDGIFECAAASSELVVQAKLIQAKNLRLNRFYDSDQDVCDAMNDAGILCFKVPTL